jgi:hypothetical protein
MLGIKVILFFLTVVTTKCIFIFINDIGDKKINFMKELIDFTEFLRIYSCDMKMSIDEIFLKYNFKNNKTKIIGERLLKEIKTADERNIDNFSSFIEETVMTGKDFNNIFAEILNFYGNTYSDVLDKKLSLLLTDMEKIMRNYQEEHKEKKNLNNRVSLLLGCLTAIILV